jgi:hypothetical protein
MSNQIRMRAQLMCCPKCGADTSVIDSRPSNDNSIRRRRRCEGVCGERFTTYETISESGGVGLVPVINLLSERVHTAVVELNKLGDMAEAVAAVIISRDK